MAPFFTGNWGVYAQNPDTAGHVFGTSEGAGTAILTFLGGFHPQTESLWLTDMAHHHLAIAVVFIIAGHMYRTNWGIGHSMKDILNAHKPPSGKLGDGHTGMYDTVNNSFHFQLGLALACLGVVTSLVAQHMYCHAVLCLPRYKIKRPMAALYHPSPIHCWFLDGGCICPRSDLLCAGLRSGSLTKIMC